MAESRLQTGVLVSTRIFTRTETEFRQILAWFMQDKIDPDPEGLTAAQLGQWRLDQVHEEIWRYVRQEAHKNRLRELRAAQANIDEQATNDVAL